MRWKEGMRRSMVLTNSMLIYWNQLEGSVLRVLQMTNDATAKLSKLLYYFYYKCLDTSTNTLLIYCDSFLFPFWLVFYVVLNNISYITAASSMVGGNRTVPVGNPRTSAGCWH